MSKRRKIAEYYKVSAVLLLNTLIVFLALNVLLFVFSTVAARLEKKENVITQRYGVALKVLRENFYPELSEADIEALLSETWSRPHVYEPYTQYKEAKYTGRFVNVDERGFRITKGQGPWPSSKQFFTVFLFGGSTAFSYGLPDNQTLASYLQDALSNSGLSREVKVYNFGRGGYYSTQERILFERLLSEGNVPDMAVFVDGLNDFRNFNDEPLFNDSFKSALSELTSKNDDSLYLKRLLLKVPVIGTLHYIKNRIRPSREEEVKTTEEDDRRIVRQAIDHYLANKMLIEATARAYKVTPVFVWQPIPTYKYDLSYHMFPAPLQENIYSKLGYPEMAKISSSGELGNNFLWCADIQEGAKKPLYVDRVHYSPEMTNKLATFIADLIVRRNLALKESD